MKKKLSSLAVDGSFDKRLLACHQQHISDFLRREREADAYTADFLRGSDEKESEDEDSYILQKVGNVAIVEIKGRLTNSDRSFNQFFGLLSYAEIQRAYAQIAADEEITSIIEDYDTPGGTVAGMAETEDIMRMVGRTKPRYGFVGSMAASAGYYLIRGCKEIKLSSMAEIGSIGVLQVVADVVKMYENEGIGLTVIKSGDLKAAGNPYEKLSDDQEKYLAGQVQYLAGMFYDAVSADRNMSSADLGEAGITSGRTFIGQQAIRCGLADNIGSFTDLLNTLASRQESGNNAPNSQPIYSEGVDMKRRKVVAPATAAAIVTGATGHEASVNPDAAGDVAGENQDQPVVDPEQPAAEGADTGEAPVEGAEVGASEDNVAEDQPTEGSKPDADVQLAVLKEALASAKADTKAAERAQYAAEARAEQAEARVVEAQAETADAVVISNKLAAIVGGVINNMNVALGRGQQSFKDMSGDKVAAQYEAVKEEFSQAYLAGGVTGTVEDEADAKTMVRDSAQQAVVDSVGL